MKLYSVMRPAAQSSYILANSPSTSAFRFSAFFSSDACFSLAELVAKAAQLIIDAKRKKQDYEEYFSQTDMFGETEDSENIRNIARALVANIRSGKRMGEMLVNAAQKILREAESQAQGAGLFGDEMPPMSRQEMIDLIIKKPEEETANPQLF